MPIVLYVLLSMVLLILFSGAYTFIVACVRRREPSWFNKDEISKTSYGKYYEHICVGHSFMKEHNAMDVYIKSFDGLRLQALWVPVENSRGTILFAHGYRSCKFVDFSLAFDIYHKLGMNILVVDQRAHGESEGKIITFGVKESRDIQSWIAFHNQNFGMHPIILSGLSMGASTMLYLADKDLPGNVRGIIADCGFTSPKEIMKIVAKKKFKLPKWFVSPVGVFAKIFGGFDYSYSTMKSLVDAKAPILFIHGSNDDFVPCYMTEQNFDACASEKKKIIASGAPHGYSFLFATDEIKNAIENFILK